eukprot:3339102-Pyramimonas_sp.AAC.1
MRMSRVKIFRSACIHPSARMLVGLIGQPGKVVPSPPPLPRLVPPGQGGREVGRGRRQGVGQ